MSQPREQRRRLHRLDNPRRVRVRRVRVRPPVQRRERHDARAREIENPAAGPVPIPGRIGECSR